MLQRFPTALAALLISALLALLASPASAAIVNFKNAANGDYRVSSIIGLQVGLSLYNVDFVHGGTYEEFVASITEPLSPITFTSLGQAQSAALAMANAVNDLSVDTSGWNHLPGDFRVPWRTRGTTIVVVDYARSGRVIANPIHMSTSISGSSSSISSPTVDSGSSTNQWALFYVPEPTSALAMIVAASITNTRGRRRTA